jgi:ABC-type uncharacterized transport system substrate-binding protein
MIEEDKKSEEIIFQVKVDRDTQEFELVSASLENFEHIALIEYLESYVRASKSVDVKKRISEYCIDYDEDEEDLEE